MKKLVNLSLKSSVNRYEMDPKVSYKSLKAYSSGINCSLKHRKIKIDQKDIKWPQDIPEERYVVSTEEIQKLIQIARMTERHSIYD